MKKTAILLPYKFNLSDCEATINLIESSENRGYGVAFLNIKFPDGRWISFKSVEGMRVVMYEEKKAAQISNDNKTKGENKAPSREELIKEHCEKQICEGCPAEEECDEAAEAAFLGDDDYTTDYDETGGYP